MSRSILGDADRAVQLSAAKLLAGEIANKQTHTDTHTVLPVPRALKKNTRGQRKTERGKVSAALGARMGTFKGAIKSL